MSTIVHQQDLHTDIWLKDEIAESLHKQAYSVQRQIDANCDKIEIHLFGMEIHLEYDEKEINVVA